MNMENFQFYKLQIIKMIVKHPKASFKDTLSKDKAPVQLKFKI